MDDRFRGVPGDLPGPVPGLRQDSRLERRYRRLLACYPARYRRVHEDEMLAVLMSGAPDGKHRPGLAEAADLILGALRVWCQPSRGGMAGRRGALALIAAGALLGLLAGIVIAAARPPLSGTDVAIRPDTPGKPFSNLVLERAAQAVRPALARQDRQSQVQISRVSGGVVLISATGANAEHAATAVAHSYIAYLSGQNALSRGGKMHPKLLYVSSVSPRGSEWTDVLDAGGLGALSGGLCGAVIGALGVAALSRRPGRRFRIT